MLFLQICALILALPFQQAVNSATVSGHIEDQTGASIAAASVTIRSVDRNQSATAITDNDGRFRFLYLPVGSYELRVENPGFAPATGKLTLSVGQTLEIPIQMSVAGLRSEVNVEEDLPLIELARTQFSETIAPKEVDALPLNGRNYL